ncbi:MAG: diguanylate cyclase [Epsilonproteobacteria bacterium]|nr:diguanylate cyclase [Campylobacterota bacterium]
MASGAMDYLNILTILYVEDDESVRNGYTRALERCTKRLFVAQDGEEGLVLYKQYKPDLVISDIKMPKKNGVEMVREIKEINPDQVVIFTTAHSENYYLTEALDLQVEAYLKKPVDKDKLKNKIASIAKTLYIEKENLEQKSILQQVIDHQSSLTILTDFETISFASKSFLEFFEMRSLQELTSKSFNFLNLFVKHQEYLYGENKETFLKKYFRSDPSQRVVSIVGGDFHPKAFQIDVTKITHDNRALYIINLNDITLLKEKNIKAEYRANHDSLTGIYNKSKFQDVLSYELQKKQRYQIPFCVAILDIDYFKRVNDTYGHLVGDEILKLLAETVESNVRKTDTFARWGGEEFCLLMSETRLAEAKIACEKIRKLIEDICHVQAGKITISIGVTEVLPDDTAQKLFVRCDRALYSAKSNGRNQVQALVDEREAIVLA